MFENPVAAIAKFFGKGKNSGVSASIAPPIIAEYVDDKILPDLKGKMTQKKLFGQAKKMVRAMGMLEDKQELSMVGDFVSEKTVFKVQSKDGKAGKGITFEELNHRYRNLEKEAIKARAKQRENLEYLVAANLGKSISEIGVKYNKKIDGYLSTTQDIDVRISGARKTKVETMPISEKIQELDEMGTGMIETIKNLEKVYKSKALATEKYISHTRVGRAAEAAFEAKDKKTEALARRKTALEALPVEKRTFGHSLKKGMLAIKQLINKPLGYAEAVGKAAAGLVLADSVMMLDEAMGKPIEKLWTETEVVKGASMQELAGRLEEKLLVDPLTGQGVRTGGITEDKIRDASVAGAEWAFKMNVLPGLLAKAPVIKALSLNPGEIYSMMRSSNMIKSGVGSIKKFKEMWAKKKTLKEKGEVAAWVLGSGAAFYAAEKLTPLIGPINPVLMGDIALMRLVGGLQSYAGEKQVEMTNAAENLEKMEDGIMVAFAADSANSLGERVWTYAETGSLDPVAKIKDEETLVKTVEEHPEVLRHDNGGPFGWWTRFEHKMIEKIKGIKAEDNNWQTFDLEGKTYHVDPGEQGSVPLVIRQDKDGVSELTDGGKWVQTTVEPLEVPVLQPPIPETREVTQVSTETEVATTAVHDYVYFEPDTTKMAFRMDLKPGETWDTKVARLFDGYGEGAIDDPSGSSFLEGKSVQGMETGSPELIALAGKDGIYESQIHKELITRLLDDASKNGLVYDRAVVQSRMVDFLKTDTTADADTVEGEIDYAELYQNLFLGSRVTKITSDIETSVYKPYFLSGNEGTNKGVEVEIVIPEGGTFTTELSSHGYGSGDGQIYDAQSRLLDDAKIVKLNPDGTEKVITDWSELDSVFKDDKFVVRTGVGTDVTEVDGKMPEIVPLAETTLSSWERPLTQAEVVDQNKEWEEKVVRNEAGEIYMGEVKSGDTFTQMMIDRFEGNVENSWDLLSVFQNMDVNGVSVYAENAQGEKRYLNSYDDLGTVNVGEKIVIVDPNKVFSEIRDLTVTTDLPEAETDKGQTDAEKSKDDWTKDDKGAQTGPTTPPPIAGFTPDGRLDLDNPPETAVRDIDGNIYIGEIKDGTWLSMLVGSHLSGMVEGDAWQKVYSLYVDGKIEILEVSDEGTLVPVENIDAVSVGDRIVIRDIDKALDQIESFNDVQTLPDDVGSLPLEHPESSPVDVTSIDQRLENAIKTFGEDVKVKLTVIDPDNSDNAIRIGNQEMFNTNAAREMAIAMVVLKMADRGQLELGGESKFVVLPGDYKPSIEQLLQLMIVYNDKTARDGLIKEFVGQDMNALFEEGTGIKEVIYQDNTTTDQVAQMYKTYLRTTYLSEDSRLLLDTIMQNGQANNGSLLGDDLGIYRGIEVNGISTQDPWGGVASGDLMPEYSTFANVKTPDGRDLIVVMTIDSKDAEMSRSAFRTVARELFSSFTDEGINAVQDHEIKADIANEITDSALAQRDYVSHVIFPYRREDGSYVVDPVIEKMLPNASELDLMQYDQKIMSYADGSGVITLSNKDTNEQMAIFVDKNNRVSMGLNSAELSSKNVGFEVAVGEVITDRLVGENFVADSKNVQINVSVEAADNFDTTTSEGRKNYLDVMKAMGYKYDFYIFAEDSGSNKSTIVYGRDGAQRDLGALPQNVNIALVQGYQGEEIVNSGLQESLGILVDKISTNKEVTDIVWNEYDVDYSTTSDDRSEMSDGHWFSGLVSDPKILSAIDKDIPPDEAPSNYLFPVVINDTQNIDIAGGSNQATIEGINYFDTVYIPQGMEIDKAVVARSYGKEYGQLVITPTNDSSVYLVGERISGDEAQDITTQVSFTHPQDEVLYQYTDGIIDGTLTSTFVNDPLNPLVAVYPIERPLETYVSTDKLIPLDEKIQVKLQYMDKPYFVSSDVEGKNSKLFVDPNSMTPYVRDGKDFIPAVVDSFTYKQMGKLYEEQKDNVQDLTKIWERRVSDSIVSVARANNIPMKAEQDMFVIYDKDGAATEKLLSFVYSPENLPMVDSRGNFVFKDNSDQQLSYDNGKFVSYENTPNITSIKEYLKDYSYLTNDEGVSLQYKGFPLIAKDDLIYIVSQEGISLVGSQSDFQLLGYVADDGVKLVLDKWGVAESSKLELLGQDYASRVTQDAKILHGMAVANERLLELKDGIIDLKTGDKYIISQDNSIDLVSVENGQIVMQKEGKNDYYVWENNDWREVEKSKILSKDEFLQTSKMVVLEDNLSGREVVDRRTRGTVYTDGTYAYTYEATGLNKIGDTQAMLKNGFVGYLDETGTYQAVVPETYWELVNNHDYTIAENVSMRVNPFINSVVNGISNISNTWSDQEIRDVLPSLKDQDYVSYDSLPQQYVAALLSQENKTLYRADEGEAANLDFGVLVKMVLSGGSRGGSTLVQGLVKNILMSPDDRLDRTIGRKVSEVLMADQILETMSVEEVVGAYVNSVSFGSIDGNPITGIGEASRVILGKNVQDLDLVDIGMLVSIPNYPTRNNLYFQDNAIGWADSSAGVFRHMYENGFITESEMKQAFLDVNERILPSGTKEDIELLIENGIIAEADRVWAEKAMKDYGKLSFDDRQLVEVKPLELLTSGPSTNTEIPSTFTYADFYQYLYLLEPAKFRDGTVKLAYDKYYYYGKLPSRELNQDFESDYLAPVGPIPEFKVGEAYTTRPFDPENPDYLPRVEVDFLSQQVSIDPWSYRYEAMEKNSKGESYSFNVLGNSDKNVPIVQDNQGMLWEVTSDGLVKMPGHVYQVEGGGAVQANLANDRPGMLVSTSGEDINDKRFVSDNLGNYYKVLDDGLVSYVGRVMVNAAGFSLLYELDLNTTYETTSKPDDFLLKAVKNAMNYRGVDPEIVSKLDQVIMTPSTDPNVGYVAPANAGEYGSINPQAAELLLRGNNIPSKSIEFKANLDGEKVFEKYVKEVLDQKQSLVVWLNNDLASDVVLVDTPEKNYFETVSRYERPVSILKMFEYQGERYVVYQDPAVIAPQIVSWDRFADLASPSNVGRYKTLIVGEYNLPQEYGNHLFDPNNQVSQVGMLMGDGYQYNYENPGKAEDLMSINPDMQRFVTEEAKTALAEGTGTGFIGMAMDESGRMPFFVSLDKDGNPANDKATYGTYQPGSVFKLATALQALDSGISPQKYYEAGDYVKMPEGDTIFNWTMDPVTGMLVYAMGADASMTITEGIKYSNNPFFINMLRSSGDPAALSNYARQIGFGDGKGVGIGLPGNDSLIPDANDPNVTERDFIYTSIGQGPVAVAPLEMLRFVASIGNNGDVIEPLIAREQPGYEVQKLPNKAEDYAVIAEAMRQVTSDPGGTAYSAFGDVQGYEVYGKTGTAEIGGDANPHAWFVGWAVDKATGEKLSFVFLIPNGGQGSQEAAPVARAVLDKYFSDLNANKAKSQVIVADPTTRFVPLEPAESIERADQIEQGITGFNLEAQPNKDLIKFTSEATRIANQYRPSDPNLNKTRQGIEFVDYLKSELSKSGYTDLMNSESMQPALDLLSHDYLTPRGSNDNDKLEEPVQCVAWEVFIGQTRGILAGAPISMTIKGDAEDMAKVLLSDKLQNGDSTNGGTVVKFIDDRPDITLFEAGDAFFIRYKGSWGQDQGHTGLILATAKFADGRPAVLVSDSNRYVDENGVLVTNGLPRMKWMGQEEFIKQYQREGNREQGIAPSQFVILRPDYASRVESVFDPNYKQTVTQPEVDIQEENRDWTFVPKADGLVELPFEGSSQMLEKNVGEMRPIDSIYIHWSGADSTDTSTWTSGMVRNGLVGQETSATFAVGVDGILQLAKLTPTTVQETYATPWRHGAINIEIAGQDSDDIPPSPKEYENTVSLVTQLLISSNKPVSIVKPHSQEVYIWSDDRDAQNEPKGWITIDSRDISDLMKVNYWNEEKGTWSPLSEADFAYNPESVQSKVDPGEQFFARLTADVKQRLVELGRADLAEIQPTIEPDYGGH